MEELNNIVREESLKGRLVNQINYQVDPDLVSSDIIGDTCCSVLIAILLLLQEKMLFYIPGMITNMDIQNKL